MNKEKFSFSKITSFHNCQYNYYLTYILKNRGGQNIYGELGTSCHEIIEGLIKGEINDDAAITKFTDDLEYCDLMDLEFPKYKGSNEGIKYNYVTSIKHYFDNFELYCEQPDYESIEEYFEMEIQGVLFRGYIDYYYIKGDDLYCIDFKTSSKFSKKDFEKKKLQLVVYGLYLHSKYPDKKIHLMFDMLKYIKGARGGLKERHKLDFMEDGERGMLEVEYNDETVKELEDFVKNTYDEIIELKNKNEDCWQPKLEPNKDYFCMNLCGNSGICKYYNKKGR